MKIEQDIASEEYEDLLTRVESLEKITVQINIGGDQVLGNLKALGLITGIFRSGTGIKDVDLTGFQMDGDELVGQASGVDQIVLDADTGLLTAGAGAVTLDADGIRITEGSGAANTIDWIEASGSNLIGRIFCDEYATDAGKLYLRARAVDPADALALFDVRDTTDTYAATLILASSGALDYDASAGKTAASKRLAITGADLKLATAQKKIQFVDSSTEIWESAGSDLSFKDANAGTLTLKQLYGQKIVMGAPTELTLDTDGEITVTQSYHSVDTFEDAATDDLVAINGGAEGMILVLKSADGARDTTVKDTAAEIALAGDADFTLSTVRDRLTLLHDGTQWCELSRSSN